MLKLDSSTSPGPPMTKICEPLGPGKAGRKVTVATNLYDLRLGGDGVYHRYHVDITRFSLATHRPTDLGKGAGNDHVLNVKREQCWRVFKGVVAKYPRIFSDPCAVAFDRRNLLISKGILDLGEGEMQKLELIVDKPGQMDGVTEPTRFEFLLKYESRVVLSDLTPLVSANLDERDRSMLQCLEIIISQVLYANENLVHFGCKTYLKQNEGGRLVDLGNGRYYVPGIHHSLIPVTNTNTGQPTLCLQIDTKSGAFYKPQDALITAAETLSTRFRPFNVQAFHKDGFSLSKDDHRRLQFNFCDLRVRDKAQGNEFTIDGISHEPVSKLEMEYKDPKNGKTSKMSVVNFYRDVLGYAIGLPHLPAFFRRTKIKGGKIYHPMEVCMVEDCQRVEMRKQTPEQMQLMIKESAKKPTDLSAKLSQMAHQTKMTHNANLQAMALAMAPKPRSVTGRVLDAPGIKYKGGQTKGAENGDWRMPNNAKYVKGGSGGKWMAYLTARTKPNSNEPSLCQSFVHAFKVQAEQKGLVLGYCEMKLCPPTQLELQFKQADRIDYFLFIIDRDDGSNVKDKIKMLEHRYGIVTQCVTLKKALEIGRNDRGSGQVIENIVNKANLKLGGMNYHLTTNSSSSRWLRGDGKVMLIGCDVNHPPAQPRSLKHLPPREPSVVGFVGNHPKEPLLFTGEISFQSPREEIAQDVLGLGGIFAKRWMAANGGRLPEEIVYQRDGVSDGQFLHILEREVPLLRDAFKAAGPPGYEPKLTVIIAKKRHNFRAFNPGAKMMDNARKQDIPVGTVLDAASGVTHPGQANMYIKTHSAIQGTARMTHYTIVMDEVGYSQDEFDNMINVLAHDHQIVNKPVSIPAPVMGAHEMAERGKRIWRAYNEEELSSGRGSSVDDDYAEPNWERITALFRVSNHPRLAQAKHWA